LGIPRLILVTDSSRLERESFFVAVEAALKGGVDAVLARERQLTSARLLALCARLRTLTQDYGARLIVHTQADVAQAVAADGVHVSAAAIGEIPVMRQWLGDTDMGFSASCHTAGELDEAATHGADFALLSPVFPTRSHPGTPGLGVQRFQEIARQAPLPVIGLGGISTENCKALAGFGIAIISAVFGANDPEAAARQLYVSS